MYPNLPGVVIVMNDMKAVIPLELCHVPPGQFFKKRLPAAHMAQLLKLSSKRPQQRLNLVKEALTVSLFVCLFVYPMLKSTCRLLITKTQTTLEGQVYEFPKMP